MTTRHELTPTSEELQPRPRDSPQSLRLVAPPDTADDAEDAEDAEDEQP
ncbi:hypothetical protein [Streptomyces sp. NEAU-W12]|nr:hypothetical protein [Streptomyces sp. NEAU-W12]